MEENGKLRFSESRRISHDAARHGQKMCGRTALPHALIIDRTVIPRNLQSAGWTLRCWSASRAAARLRRTIFFSSSVNDSGTITLILKDTKEDSGR